MRQYTLSTLMLLIIIATVIMWWYFPVEMLLGTTLSLIVIYRMVEWDYVVWSNPKDRENL
jgi:hypothetical protein